MIVRGFSESILTQILGAIRRGSVNMEDELHAINDMPELQCINYVKARTLEMA
jgi:hypothetical protein